MSPDSHKNISRILDAERARLAEAITARHFELKPDLSERFGDYGRKKCLEDNGYHLSYLSEAIAAASPALFADYIVWAKVMLAGRGVPAADLADNLVIIRDSLRQNLSGEAGEIAGKYIDEGLKKLPETPSSLVSKIENEEPLAALAKNYLDALLKGKRVVASLMILDAVKDGVGVKDIYLHVFQKAQHEIGRLWQENKLSVAEEHYCTAATQLIMSQLYPYIFNSERNGRTIVATCVANDLHEIGVRMVSDFFEMEGWDTFYLGANVPTPSVLQTLKERQADLILISATMTFHIRHVRELIEAIRAEEELKDVKIMVGGYPFNVAPELSKDVGADDFAPDALRALEIAAKLVGGEQS